MGTLNPYRAPFLDGNWIIDTANTIGVNHFQLKLILEMFEMFVLLINEINPHSFCFVSYLFSFYLHAWSSPTQRMLHTIFWIAYLRISRGNLPWLFSARICRGDLPQESAVRTCRRYLPWVFCIYMRILFCIYEQILFI